MKKWQKTAAVLVCAGSGTRMQNACADKLLLPIAGMPLAAYAVRAYDAAKTIGSMVIVTRRELLSVYALFCEKYDIRKPLTVCVGGESRMESVLCGVRMVPQDVQFVAIGDGARPLIRPEDIDATVRAAFKTGAAALGVPVTDTIKKTVNGTIVKTVPRESLAAIQTPQVFAREEYLICATAAASLHEAFTDDASIYERFGKPVTLVAGHRDNWKITAPEDIALLKALLEDRKCE